MQISIVIVNWNAGEQLYRCVNSVVKYSNGLDVEIVVVDNGSLDNSLELISGLPKTSIIRTGENLGFGKACNLGAKQATGEFLLFLNPDAEVYEDSLKRTYEFMVNEDNHKIGVCGVQLINEKDEVDRSCSRFPSLKNLLFQALGINKIFKSAGMKMLEWTHDFSQTVDQVIGAYFFIRSEIFNELHGFDERFFVYFEEVDLSLRVHQSGYDSYFISDIQAFHAGGGVSQQVKARRLFYSWRSRVLYVFKHLNFFQASFILLTTLLAEPFSRSIFAVIKGQFASVGQTWQAWWMLLSWLPRWWIKGETRP